MKRNLQIGSVSAQPGEKAHGWIDVAEQPSSVIRIPVMITNGYDDGPILFLNSGSHGSEYNPIEANIRLQRSFDPSKLKGAVISSIITNCNAFDSRTQYVNPIDGKNVNRVFPGKLDGTISERIAYIITNEFVTKADYVFDLHGGDFIEDLAQFNIVPLSGDSKVDEESLMLDRCFGGDFVLTMGGAGGLPTTTLPSQAILRKKPAMTVEGGGQGRIEEPYASYHVNGVTNAMKFLKMIDGEPVLKEHRKVPKSYPIALKHGGIWHPKVKPGMLVSKGQTLGDVMNVFGETVERLEAPADGVIQFFMYPPTMNSGDTVLWMGEFE